MSGRMTPQRPSSGLGLFSHTASPPSSSLHGSSPMQPIQASGSASASTSTSVQVVLRIRPPPQPDAASTIPPRFQRSVVQPTNGSTTQLTVEAAPPGAKGPQRQHFSFDRVIGPQDGQASVYEAVEPLVSRFMEGYNVTVLAYGQTSSGKSYTMGTDTLSSSTSSSLSLKESSSADSDGGGRAGIIPRAVKEIFDEIDKRTRTESGKWKCDIKTSYIEIYNEDLIDLLAGDSNPDERTPVTIREDKAGHIIWSGLKEVKVKTGNEVMKNLEAGSAIRQTGSTAMNDQSSRSHAIFSLTLIQRKYIGQGTVPLQSRSADASPSVPQPSGFSTPSRASVRYSSAISSRVASPTPGSTGSPRPATPGESGRPGSRLIPRPSSVLGGAPSPINSEEEEHSLSGYHNNEKEWNTVVSKFHFVDLAGSERLKRTSAVGDRAKEGISINGGLLALGNVVSALGDPVKARQTTHIPYRDSKLTRLLQDSLGGNAHTLMIACISPVEYNLSETLNTLKYANRARNIKNRAELNEIEAGWDDVEHLQQLVTRLRNELSSLQGGNGLMPAIAEEDGTPRFKSRSSPTSASLLLLQDQYSDLSTRYAKLTAELAKAQAAAVSPSSMSPESFAQAVEPVVEEYEKSISALESQLSLTKAALSHSEGIMRETEERINSDSQVNENNTKLINEMRNRMNKVLERESVTEAYIRDLESRLKSSTEQDEASTTLISDLKKEISKYREIEGNTEEYIKELELRLSRSEEVQHMQNGQIETLQRDIQRREKAYGELEKRLSLLDTTDQHKQLLIELDERDKRILDIETELEEARLQLSALEAITKRLQASAETDANEKQNLQRRLESLEKQPKKSVSNSNEPSSATPTSSAQSLAISNSLTPPQTPLHEGETTSGSSDDLASKLSDLEKKHEMSLKDLEIMSHKYNESLKQLEELQGIRYRKKSNAEEPDSSSENQHETLDDVPEEGSSETPRKATLSPITTASYTTPTRPSRGSNSRRSMPHSPRGSFLGRSPVASHSASHLRSASASLSQESLSAQSLNGVSTSSGTTSMRTSHGSFPHPSMLMAAANGTSSPRPNSPLLNRRESLLQAGEIFFPHIPERSNASLQQEVKKLQQTLDEREEEIRALEANLVDLKFTSRDGDNPSSDNKVLSVDLPNIVADDTLKTPIESNPPNLLSLSPNTVEAFNAIKKNMNKPEDVQVTDASDAQLARLDDLMLSMAKKEVVHQEKVQELEEQLSTLKKQHEELRTLSKDQVLNMSTEITALREELSRNGAETELWENKLSSMDSEIKERREQVAEMLDGKALLHEQALQSLRDEYSQVLLEKEEEHELVQLRLEEDHAALLQRMLEAKEELFMRKAEEHDAVVHRLNREHQQELQRRDLHTEQAMRGLYGDAENNLRHGEITHKEALDRLGLQLNGLRDSNHAELATKLNVQHEAAIKMRVDQHKEIVDSLRAGHAEALAHRQHEYASSLASVQEEHESTLTRLSQEHSHALQEVRQERDDALKDSQAAHEAEVANLVEQDKEDLANIVREVEQRVDLLQKDHEVEKSALQKQYEFNLASELERVGASHAESQNALADEHSSRVQAHQQALENMSQKHAEELAAEKELSETTLVALQEQHQVSMSTLRESHATAMSQLIEEYEKLLAQREANCKSEDQLALAQLEAEHARHVQDLTETHEAHMAELTLKHDQALVDVKSSLEGKIQELTSTHAASAEANKTQSELELAELTRNMEEAVTSKAVVLSDLATANAALADQQHQIAEYKTRIDVMESQMNSKNAKLQGEIDSLRLSSDEASKKEASLKSELQETLDALSTLEQALIESQDGRERLMAEIGDLQKYAKVALETEELTVQLAASKEERKRLEGEIERLTALLSTRRPLSPAAQGQGLGNNSRSSKDQETLMPVQNSAEATPNSNPPLPSPSSSHPIVRHASVVSLVNGSHPSSRPPPTPPPSMPPPPLPVEALTSGLNNSNYQSSINDHHHPYQQAGSSSTVSFSNKGRESVSSVFTRDSHMDNTTMTSNRTTSMAETLISVDPRVHQKFEEQEAALTRLTKRLEHAEIELKANIDLVTTLESALNDSERNLRKSRLKMNELAKEREALQFQNDHLKQQIMENNKEVDKIKKILMVNEEESRNKLEAQRKAQREAQMNAEMRMAEIQRLNRKSKFNCF